MTKCEHVYYYRLKDAAQSFNQSNDGLRFSSKNPFDVFLFSGYNGVLYGLELKSIKGKSISFERSKKEKAVIHYHQQIGLEELNKCKNTISGFILNYRELNKTYFLHIEKYLKLINSISKKSFNINDLLKYEPLLINQCIKRVRYTYDIENFIQKSCEKYII